MSGMAQASKGLNRKGLACGNRSRFNSKGEAEAYIQNLINKNQRGSKSLVAYPCKRCGKKQEKSVIHVGHKQRKAVKQ